MTGRLIRILHIEDDDDYAQFLRLCLEEPDSLGLKFELRRAERLSSGLELLRSAAFDAVLLDLLLPDSFGIDTVAQALAAGRGVPIVVTTSLDDEAAALDALRLGAQDYLIKYEEDSPTLKSAILQAVERRAGGGCAGGALR